MLALPTFFSLFAEGFSTQDRPRNPSVTAWPSTLDGPLAPGVPLVSSAWDSVLLLSEHSRLVCPGLSQVLSHGLSPSHCRDLLLQTLHLPAPHRGGVALGGAVTVRCQGQHQNMRFLLYKDGNPTALQYVEPTGNVAEFPICNVTWRDAGSYRCCYHSKMYQFLRSHPSDPVELVVAGSESWPQTVGAVLVGLAERGRGDSVLGHPSRLPYRL
uniref:Ig-like domain-containing protein n=1 Tax=Chelonoidis abingdonii TaxID=106734 RepID=A0A8C0J1M8_CHEAB